MSLQGNYKAEHLFALQQALEAYDFYQSQIQKCDEQIEGVYNAFEPQVDIEERPLPPSRKKRRKPKDNEPEFDLRLYLYQMAGVDLTEIDGVNVLTAQVVLSEISFSLGSASNATSNS